MALKLIELFGGIGACSSALTKLGIEYEIVDYVEIDKYAVKSYNAIHGTNFEPQDITTWDKDIEVDLIMHGSPCQDFSLAGKQAGGDKDSGTRSSLMYETIRIVEKLKPKYVIWENVKNLLSKKHFHNFNAYLETMKQLGYMNYYQVLNAKDYGTPQNRERVFTISIRDDSCYLGDYDAFVDEKALNFEFPPKQPLKLKLKDMLEENVDEKFYLSDKQIKCLSSDKVYKNGYLRGNQFKKNINPDVCTTITASSSDRASDTFISIKNATKKGYLEATDGGGKDRLQLGKETSGTLQTSPKEGVCYNDLRIRKLTPRECWRLMGFTDEEFNRAAKVNSNTQLYKQAGNSIVVNVLMAILEELIK